MLSVILLMCMAPVVASQSADPIKIGVIQPLTGPVAFEGTITVDGIKMAEEDINAAGGVLGRPIKFIVEDGKNDPAESVNAAERLITRDKVCAVIGAWGSSSTLAIMPVVQKYGRPLIVETSTSPKITSQGNKWVFRITTTNGIDALHLEKVFVKELGFKKVAFLAANNDWGRSVVEAYSEALKRQGGTVVLAEYYSAGETNFYSFLTKIKGSGADSLIITADIQSLVMINRQYAELGMNLKRLATSGFSTQLILDLLGPKIAEGIYSVDYFPHFDPPAHKADRINAFVERYKKAHPDKGFQANIPFGYDAARIIADAIARAGSTDPEKIRVALTKTKFDGIIGDLEFDETGQGYPYVFLAQVKNGKPVVVKTFLERP